MATSEPRPVQRPEHPAVVEMFEICGGSYLRMGATQAEARMAALVRWLKKHDPVGGDALFAPLFQASCTTDEAAYAEAADMLIRAAQAAFPLTPWSDEERAAAEADRGLRRAETAWAWSGPRGLVRQPDPDREASYQSLVRRANRETSDDDQVAATLDFINDLEARGRIEPDRAEHFRRRISREQSS
jgi:hypothetical protein